MNRFDFSLAQFLTSARGRTGNIFDSLDSLATRRLIRKVGQIVESPNLPRHYDVDEVFWKLQNRYTWRGYKYDDYSVWKRAAENSIQILDDETLSQPGKRVLEVGCGDGIAGLLISSYGHGVLLTDIEDWRHQRAQNLDFLQGDICQAINVASEEFDLIYSINTFEHISDPTSAMKELWRIVKPGGIIHLSFGPLFCSPWGLHAYKTVFMPYPQFLFSAEYLNSKLQELGIHDLGVWRESLQSLNRWRVGQYNEAWAQANSRVVIKSYSENASELHTVLEYPEAFTGRGLTVPDLVTESITVKIQKLHR